MVLVTIVIDDANDDGEILTQFYLCESPEIALQSIALTCDGMECVSDDPKINPIYCDVEKRTTHSFAIMHIELIASPIRLYVEN